MTRDHADFYLGTGPDARWLGSLVEVGGPDQVSRLDTQAGHCRTPSPVAGGHTVDELFAEAMVYATLTTADRVVADLTAVRWPLA
ncbi:hypothetical protein F0L68_04650 [Solihabitans fulvus]|uniref:Uncharacterized protein n=1 Tax=Solihabitans fulvus TaxID=1892852 RepID=A0A5B2XQZ1_9PSEU|nr:hypothetical protein [Solihabitans fulvus]KAA2265364.1 hypothetical protein F0L68_04650 [Solihabitans fulvus]